MNTDEVRCCVLGVGVRSLTETHVILDLLK